MARFDSLVLDIQHEEFDSRHPPDRAAEEGGEVEGRSAVGRRGGWGRRMTR